MLLTQDTGNKWGLFVCLFFFYFSGNELLNLEGCNLIGSRRPLNEALDSFTPRDSLVASAANPPTTVLFGTWEETKETRGNPHRHGEHAQKLKLRIKHPGTVMLRHHAAHTQNCAIRLIFLKFSNITNCSNV